MSDEVRDKLSLYGIAHEDLTDAQLAEASERIVRKFDGQTPDLQDIAIVVDQVRAEANNVEGVAAGVLPGEESVGTDDLLRAGTPSAHPVSTRCSGCTPRYLAHTPSGGGWFHERSCTVAPNHKLPRTGNSAAKETHRLRSVHAAEDAKAAVIPIRQVGSCAKCGGPTTRLPYCRPCRTLLSIVKGRA